MLWSVLLSGWVVGLVGRLLVPAAWTHLPEPSLELLQNRLPGAAQQVGLRVGRLYTRWVAPRWHIGGTYALLVKISSKWRSPSLAAPSA